MPCDRHGARPAILVSIIAMVEAEVFERAIADLDFFHNGRI